MRNPAKLAAVCLFCLLIGAMLACGVGTSPASSALVAKASPTPTAGAAPAPAAPAPAGGDKSITKNFTLGKDSLSQYGEVKFDHDSHAFKPYSPDGKSVVGCVECHHTDQPKSALKPPLKTSERDVVLTLEAWKASTQKVKECRACHFQESSVPEGKTLPIGNFTDGGKTTTKDLTNENAYHLNCNTCHDAAFAARPQLKSKPGFATSKDCLICHAKN
jgi:hypothetical protein